jgi:flagellar protein FlaG
MDVDNLVMANAAVLPSVPKPKVDAPKPAPEIRTEPTAAEKSGRDAQTVYLGMPGQDTLMRATESVNKHIEMTNRYLDMSVHEKTQRIIVKVVDKETGDIVREIPPEETLDFLAKVLEQAGIFVDTKG